MGNYFKIVILTIFLILSFSVANAAADKAEYYISETGSDYNDGSEAHPYKTIERAKKSIRYLKEKNIYPKDGVDVILREGTYLTNVQISFDSRDSGLNDAPVTYKAYDGENVVISSGVCVLNSVPSYDERLKDSVKGIVRAADVSELNLDGREESYTVNGLTREEGFTAYSAGTLFHTAQYPNEGEGYIDCTAYNDETQYYIQYSPEYADEIKRWSGIDKISIAGYPSLKWRYSKAPINSIDTDSMTIAAPRLEASNEISKTPSLWFSNILEELDTPGEYYYDSNLKVLFYYPMGDDNCISISKNYNSLLYLINTSNVSFENLIFEGGVKNGIEASGTSNLTVKNCTFRAFGGTAVKMYECMDSLIQNTKIYNIGRGGIIISGGDRYNLIPSNNLVKNCDIYCFSRVKHVYAPAVSLEGVGDTVSDCDIHDEFHQGLFFDGNDCIIENNKFYNLCIGTEDAGAIYAYSNSTCRGNIVRNNYFENIGIEKPTNDTKYSTYGVWAVYLDGGSSGHMIRNNVFKDIVGGVFVNNGGNVSVTNNTYIDVSKPQIAYPVTAEWNNVYYFKSYKGRYYNFYYNKEMWSKYKNYNKILDGTWTLPSHEYTDIVITGNKYYGELTKYIEQWAEVDDYAHTYWPYHRQVVYITDISNVLTDDANIVFENNEKYEGMPDIDLTLYGVK